MWLLRKQASVSLLAGETNRWTLLLFPGDGGACGWNDRHSVHGIYIDERTNDRATFFTA